MWDRDLRVAKKNRITIAGASSTAAVRGTQRRSRAERNEEEAEGGW